MSDQFDPTPETEDDLLAAEYVLGVQTFETRTALQSRLKTDDAFAQLVARWEQRLAGINGEFAEVAPPNLMPAIEARLFGTSAKRQVKWTGWFFGAATAMSLGLAVLTVLPPSGFGPIAPIAVLTAEAQNLRYEVRRQGDELRVERVAGDPAETGRVHELWLIAGESAPVSLGLIEGQDLVVNVPGLTEGMVFAVSLEPSGGSPTGAPTGPVLVTGVVAQG